VPFRADDARLTAWCSRAPIGPADRVAVALRLPGFERLVLRRDLSAPHLARRWIVAVAGHLPADRLDDARVIISELVTNSLSRAGGGGDIEVTAHVSPERVRVTVYDGGVGLPQRGGPSHADLVAAGAWGLLIAHELSDVLEIDGLPGAVSFEVSTPD
jgi:anti-sigma regulatory factor (Ser/Thr protein kinase)